MKTIRRLGTALTIVALAGLSPVMADDDNNSLNPNRVDVAMTATVTAVTGPAAMTVTVKSASPERYNKALAIAMRGKAVTVTTTAKTEIKRSGQAIPLSAVFPGDTVSIKAQCTSTGIGTAITFACVASRITAVTPAPANLDVVIIGSVTAPPSPTALTVRVSHASQGDRRSNLTKALVGQTITVTTDANTVVRRSTGVVPLSAVLVNDRVYVRAVCATPTAPFTCLASRITAVTPEPERVSFTMLGTVTAVPSPSALTIRVTNTTNRDDERTWVQSLHGTLVTIGTDAKTKLERTGYNLFGAVGIGDRVTAKVRCTVTTPAICVASNIAISTPTPTPTPTPSPSA